MNSIDVAIVMFIVGGIVLMLGFIAAIARSEEPSKWHIILSIANFVMAIFLVLLRIVELLQELVMLHPAG